MSKFEHLLLIRNLLYTRQKLTVEEIQTECGGITKRTVYRYINSLDKAGVPVYFDPDQRGYCLAEKKQEPLHFTRTETLFVLLAGMISEFLLGDELVQPLGQVRQKLERYIDYEEQDWLFKNHELLSRLGANSELDAFILFVTVDFAQRTGDTLLLDIDLAGSGINRIKLEQPRLEYEDVWYVAGKSGSKTARYPLTSVKSIEIA
jgi:hypothetical protein